MNKSHTSALCLLFMLILCRTPLSAQSTMGTDFWLSFIIPDELLDSNSSYSLIFATDHIDTITVSNPLLGWQKQLTAYPNQVNRLYIPYSVSLPNGNIPVSSSGIHVSSRRPISLYASIHSIASLDITNVMPTPALRDDYIVQTYPNGRYSSVFSIVATQENTEVEIQLLSDDPTRIDSSFTVQLPLPGKVYYFHTYGDADFSGTQIHARNNKRIALFCGNPRTFVPEYDERQSGDITYEQCIPTSFWGNDYIVVPCGRKTYHDHLRITALNDDCHVFVADTLAALLSAQQTYEHCLSSDSDICHIHSTQPILVGHYFASTHDGTSDPSLIFVPPLDLAIDNLQFACVNTPMTERHKAVILVRTEALLSLQFDGNPIGHHFRSLPNHDDYHYARILIDTGSHTLTSLPGNQFIAYLYGM
ncbi:MAG: IgGFc-binding protein, partial [Bacteroidales bacterium]|nr:IgGFc-binding protein [Bacteroidales bacterium]